MTMLSLMLYSRNFLDLNFIFRFVIHFELIFIYVGGMVEVFFFVFFFFFEILMPNLVFILGAQHSV